MPWAEAVNVMWGTDMTTAWTSEGQAAVFMTIDHHIAAPPSSLFVGIHATRYGNMLRVLGFEALEPV
jgi:hypothetical protein